MRILARLALVLTLLTLTACGGTPSEAGASVAPPPSTSQPSVTSVPATPTTTMTAAATATFVPTMAATGTPAESPPTATASATATPASATATTAASATATPEAETVVASIVTPVPTVATNENGVAIRPDLPGTLAFVRDGDIYTYRPQTGAVERLIENGRDMQYSRDGTQLAFVRDDGLYLADADGNNIGRIVNQSNVSAPRWTDDGSKIAFERGSDPAGRGRGEIWTVELPSGAPIKIADGADPAWAPDSKRITYVTQVTGEPRQNQLRLTNWRGQNNWGPVKNLPANTPAIGINDMKRTPDQLDHQLFAPVWDAEGRFIYAPAFVLTQIETDFTILERADATNGDSVFVTELGGVLDAFGSPDRKAILFTVGTARGDISLTARALDPESNAEQYAWAQTNDVAVSESPAWAPTNDAVAFFRCSLEDYNRCDLALLEAGELSATVLVPDVFGAAGPNRQIGQLLAWGESAQ